MTTTQLSAFVFFIFGFLVAWSSSLHVHDGPVGLVSLPLAEKLSLLRALGIPQPSVFAARNLQFDVYDTSPKYAQVAN